MFQEGAWERAAIAEELDWVREAPLRLGPEDFDNESDFDEDRSAFSEQFEDLIESAWEVEMEYCPGSFDTGDHSGYLHAEGLDIMDDTSEDEMPVFPDELASISRNFEGLDDAKQAWPKKDLEKAVELASQQIEASSLAPAQLDMAGVFRLCAGLQRRFRAYRSMGLFSLAASDANRAFDLFERFGVTLKDDRASSSSKPVLEPETLSPERGLKRFGKDDDDARGVKRLRSSPCRERSLVSLPTEVLMLIADFIEPQDRIRVANTCRRLKRIPQLWQHLTFRRTKHTLRIGWHRDTVEAIETCFRRSHGTLSGVILKGFIHEEHVFAILDALRPSRSTLKFLGIPSLDQRLCYRELYQHCNELEGLDIRIYHRHAREGSVHQMLDTFHLGRITSPFPASDMPFKLKYFAASPEIHCPGIGPHMSHLEMVRGISMQSQREPGFIEGLLRAAPTLREWHDRPKNRRETIERSWPILDSMPTAPVAFPQMRKINASWCEELLECDFPALQEASFIARDESTRHGPVVSNISRSPALKILHLTLPRSKAYQTCIFEAVTGLQSLEELHLSYFRAHEWSLQPLLEAHSKACSITGTTRVILPRLRIMGIYGYDSPRNPEFQLDRELSDFLLKQCFLQHGCTWKEAQSRTEAALVGYDVDVWELTASQKKRGSSPRPSRLRRVQCSKEPSK